MLCDGMVIMEIENELVECSLCGAEIREEERYHGTMFDPCCIDCGVTLDDMEVDW